MKTLNCKFKIYFIILIFISTNIFAESLLWQTLAPGLEYSKVKMFVGFPEKSLHIFRIDLHKYRLKLAFIKDLRNASPSVANLVKANNAVIGVNGGFFSPDLKPLGLRIDEGQVKNPLKQTSWWGVFFTRSLQAYIVSQKKYNPDKGIDFAVQSGPRLLIHGKIAPLKPGVANRTALGITRSGKVILLVTDNEPLSTNELAHFMQLSSQQGGLNCVDALNLDGGGSTQLYAKLDNFNLQVPGVWVVSDAVLVIPK